MSGSSLAHIAQLVEHSPCKRAVGSSSLSVSISLLAVANIKQKVKEKIVPYGFYI